MRAVLSAVEWHRYFQRLSQIEGKAAAEMLAAIQKQRFKNDAQMTAYCSALINKYGGATSALACEMYDEIAELQGVTTPPAEPAAVMSPQEIAQNIREAARRSEILIPPEVGRMVKQASADTMLQNARRDRAQMAFIPNGDTCAFCRVLGSRGWEDASGVSAGKHAAHVHAHCDCAYMVRFVSSGGVEGYDPQKYLDEYYAADGSTGRERINAMRRADYESNKKTILAQKRAAYAARQEREDKDN